MFIRSKKDPPEFKPTITYRSAQQDQFGHSYELRPIEIKYFRLTPSIPLSPLKSLLAYYQPPDNITT